MLLESKNEDRLAHDIKAATQIMKAYCEKYLEENKQMSILLVQTEYIIALADALCNKY